MGKIRKLLGLYTMALIDCSGYTVISPFYPGIAHSKGLSEVALGGIFALVPISGFITSLILTPRLERLGRKRAMTIGIMLQSLSYFMLAPIVHTSLEVLVVLSVLSRISSGVGSTFGMIPAYSILTSDFPEDSQKVIAYMEVSAGIGLIIGPIMGSLLYINGDVLYSFLTVAIAYIIYIPIFRCLLEEERSYVKQIENFSIMEFIYLKKILLVAIINGLILFEVAYVGTFIELHLLDLGFTEKQSGYFFGFMCLFYLISSFVIANIKTDKRLLLFLGLFVYFWGFLLIGPTYFNSEYIVVASLPLFGIAAALCSVPILPQMLDSANKDYDYPVDDRLNDAMSSLMNISSCIGEVLGPILGGLLLEFFSFARLSEVIGFIFLAFAAYYICASDYLTDLCRSRRQKTDADLELI